MDEVAQVQAVVAGGPAQGAEVEVGGEVVLRLRLLRVVPQVGDALDLLQEAGELFPVHPAPAVLEGGGADGVRTLR